MSTYIVKAGESIGDVVVNATGSLSNWDAILTANGFADWTPELAIGQEVTIPDDVTVDNNTLRQLQTYPAANGSVNNIDELINDAIGILTDNWILATGSWNDNAVWIDTDLWID